VPHIEVGTLAVDGWTITFGTAKRGLGGVAARPKAPPRCTKCNSPLIGLWTFRPFDVSLPGRFAP